MNSTDIAILLLLEQGSASPEQQIEAARLIRWLDQYVTDAGRIRRAKRHEQARG